MSVRFAIGDAVQTGLGPGVVRELRRHGRLLVEVKGRALELDERTVKPAPEPARRTPPRQSDPTVIHPSTAPAHQTAREIDLHGLTVEEAWSVAERAINAALIDDRGELRFIHGRSGGRIRGALHQRLREMTAVRGFHLDPHNPGVTVVVF